MIIKKVAFWVGGGMSALLAVAGIFAFICPETYTRILGGVMAALCLCGGMLTALPVFAVGLGLGITIIFTPKTVDGILLIAFGVVGMVAGLVVGLKLCKKTVQEKPSATEESAPSAPTEETAKEMLSGNE